MVELVDTRDLKSLAQLGMRVRVPLQVPSYSDIAQLVEQVTVNHLVPGSSPGVGAILRV